MQKGHWHQEHRLDKGNQGKKQNRNQYQPAQNDGRFQKKASYAVGLHYLCNEALAQEITAYRRDLRLV